MREIKFRAWSWEPGDERNGWWSYEVLVGQGEVYIDGDCFLMQEEDGFIVEQYTGLKDKNGVEIYEGDILSFKHYYATRRWWSRVEEIPEIESEMQKQKDKFVIGYGIVTFRFGGFRVGGLEFCDMYISHPGNLIKEYQRSGKTHTNDYEEKYWDFKVAGNIHENSELLESEH